LWACASAESFSYLPATLKKLPGKKLASKYVTADHLVKQSLHVRDNYKKQFVTNFTKLRHHVLAALCKADEMHSNEEQYSSQLLVGQGLHTRYSEAFFPETTYHYS